MKRLFVLSCLSLSVGGCLMNWGALEPDGAAAAGAAGAGGGSSGAAGVAHGGKASGGAAGTTGGTGAGGASGGTAGAGAGGATAGAAGSTTAGAAGSTTAGSAGAAGAAGDGGAAGAAGDPTGGAGGAAGAGGDAGAAGAGGDAGAAGAGGDAGAAGAGGDAGAAGAGGDAGAGGGTAGSAGAGGAVCTEANSVTDPATGHCYFPLGGGPRSWFSARDACMTAGAHLATLTSQAEQDVIATMMLLQTSWIGLSGPSGTLVWVNGEPFAFTAWGPNQPNGSGNVCVRIDSQSKLWNDDTCNKQQGAVCERE